MAGVLPGADRSEVGVRLAGDTMPALRVRPGDAGGTRPLPLGRVLLVSDMYGRSPFYERLADRLALAGFDVLLPEYFFRLPPVERYERAAGVARWRRHDEARSLDDLAAALDLAGAGPDRVTGVLGFCLGGTLALDLASLHDGRLATVAYYPFPAATGFSPRPAPAPLDLVRRQRGPVLAFWGERDDTLDPDDVTRYTRDAAEYAEDFSWRVYPGVGHSFLAAAATGSGDSPADSPAADSWARTVAHLRRHVTP